MVAEQLDLVHYLNDILMLGVDPLNRLLVAHLLDRLVIPLYIYSLEDARQRRSAGSTEEQPRIGQLLSMFLLAQKLLIMKHGPLVSSLAEFILRGETMPVAQTTDGSIPKSSGHHRYPSHGSTRAFKPPTEPLGIAPISNTSRSSSVNSIVPSPSLSSRGVANASSTTSAATTASTPDARSAHAITPQPLSSGKESPKSTNSSLSSFADVTDTGVGETVSSELIPMVSVHRRTMPDGEDDSEDFGVAVMVPRTLSVGKSRFFDESSPEERRRSGTMPQDERSWAALKNKSSTPDNSEDSTSSSGNSRFFSEVGTLEPAQCARCESAPAIASSMRLEVDPLEETLVSSDQDETDGNAPSGLVVSCDEVALEAGSDTLASPSVPLTGCSTTVTHVPTSSSESGAEVGGSDSSMLQHQPRAEQVALVVSQISQTHSEVDSGVFSEQPQTDGVVSQSSSASVAPSPAAGTESPDTASGISSGDVVPHPLQSQQSVSGGDGGGGGGGVEGGTVASAPAIPAATLTPTAESPCASDAGMSPYLKTVLTALDIESGDDRLAFYSIVVFYAILRHKGMNAEVFDKVLLGNGEVCQDIRDVMLDHVIRLIGQICHDCSTSRLITLQAALVVLQNLMKDDRSPSSAAPHSKEVAAAVMTRGESTPTDAACTSDGSVTPASSRDGLGAFQDEEPAVPNSLPPAKDASSGMPTSASTASLRDKEGAFIAALSANTSSSSSGTGEPSSPQMATVLLEENGQPRSEAFLSGLTNPDSASSTPKARQESALPQGVVFHRRVSDGHVAQLHGAYEDSVRQLRLLYKGPSDDIFLDMFEDEYFNITKGERLNIEYLMNDASTLLPPTPTPLTGIPFFKRLPNGEVERTRRAMQVFFLARQWVVSLLGEREEHLPLMPADGLQKVDDRPNLMNTDLLACDVYMDDTEKPLKRFFFIGESQMVLVEPDMTQLGWGVVRYVSALEDIDVATDSGDNSLLHVTFHQPVAKRRRFGAAKHPARQTINTWQFEFTDHIRCTAAKKRIIQACERVKLCKQDKICALLQVPNSQHRATPSNLPLVGLEHYPGHQQQPQQRRTSAGTTTPAVVAASSAAVAEVVMSPVNVPPSVPAPAELAPLVVDTAQPATGAVMRSEAGFEVISVDDPTGESVRATSSV